MLIWANTTTPTIKRQTHLLNTFVMARVSENRDDPSVSTHCSDDVDRRQCSGGRSIDYQAAVFSAWAPTH